MSEMGLKFAVTAAKLIMDFYEEKIFDRGCSVASLYPAGSAEADIGGLPANGD